MVYLTLVLLGTKISLAHESLPAFAADLFLFHYIVFEYGQTKSSIFKSVEAVVHLIQEHSVH